jgi:hypothetical protein
MENKTYIFELHSDHVEWLKALTFYEEEIEVLKKRLAEVSSKNSNVDVKKAVEKFQNKLIIQKNEIDLLKHYINQNENELTIEVKANPIASDHRKVDDNLPLRERYEIFGKLFADLKNEFNTFVGEHL